MKRKTPEVRRNRERNFNEVVEVGFATDIAQAANVMRFQSAQSAEAFEDHAGLRTDDVPTHVEQPVPGRMEEQVYAFRLADAAVTPERQGVDAIKREIIAAPNKRFELGDHAGAPRSRLLDFGHLAFEKSFLKGHHRAPRLMTDVARSDFVRAAPLKHFHRLLVVAKLQISLYRFNYEQNNSITLS